MNVRQMKSGKTFIVSVRLNTVSTNVGYGIIWIIFKKKIMDKNWLIFCCNPLKMESHWVKKDLRNVTSWMIDLNYGIKEGMKICSACRKIISKERHLDNEYTETENDNAKPGRSGDPEFMDVDESFQLLNKSLISMGESPIVKKKCENSKKYRQEKMEKIKSKLNDKFFQGENASYEKECDCDESQNEIINQFKEKFKIANKNEKFLILTSLPKSWSCARVEKEFGVGNYTARRAKKLAEEKGILSIPNTKPGNAISDETNTLVKEFYNNDDTSRQMPGKKDYVSMGRNSDGKPLHVQKRLILGNLREIYNHFKSSYPEIRIGFSKFAELRPKNCIIAGASGTHSICVCTMHQNVKLMIAGARLHTISFSDTNPPLETYKDYLFKIMCNPPTKLCFMNECDCCPNIAEFKDCLLIALEEKMIEHVTYKQWITVDRCSFETLNKPSEDFVQDFCNQLVQLKKHDFVAKQQSSYFSEKKSSLLENEIVVQCDFAENYSFVLQDEAQGFHWNNSMSTVHPCVIYFKVKDENNDDLKVLAHKSIVFISDCLSHNTVLVHTFQRKLIAFIKDEILPNLKKVYYFSDGAASQYKNRKNFSNLCCHKEDFQGVEAEWHFYATSHGKGVCDGVGGTVKRLAAKASLQNPVENQILTPLQLFQWCKEHISTVKFFYVPNQDYLENEKFLEKRFNDAIAVTGTQKYHAFIPESKLKIKTKIISYNDNYDVHKIQVGSDAEDVPFHQISGFVTCAYDNNWWLACVLSKDDNEQEVNVSFLHPCGPCPSFTYPRRADILSVPKNFIICKVNPSTATGRTYKLTAKEMTVTSQILLKKHGKLYK